MKDYLLIGCILISLAFLGSCGSASKMPDVQLPEGFILEQLYDPADHQQGSWVAMCWDDKGRIIASDQYGSLYRISPEPIGQGTKAKVDSLNVELGYANGLLYAFESLYVVVNSHEGKAGNSSGLYRLKDLDGDDAFDEIKLLKSFEGSGEHGPHSILLGPDGQSLFVLAGNHTELPEMDRYLLPPNWGEDRLFPADKDPNGHAWDRKAPGGWVAVTDPEGNEWTLYSAGYRNAFDMAFHDETELMVFDADMEWDMGMPWYRPIRLCHAIPGSEFGWRTGSGKWPDYYPDNLPAVVNIGQGSPTGVVHGKGLNFPTRFQKGLFLFDWSFGTMYFVDLQVNGSSYTGSFTEFISGVPLPLTDGAVGPDGALYFMTGGRRLQSHLYRIYYQGAASTKAPEEENLNPDIPYKRALIKGIVGYPSLNTAPAVQPEYRLKDYEADRFVRYAGRLSLERRPAAEWIAQMPPGNTQARLPWLLALARQGDAEYQEILFEALLEYDFDQWNEAVQKEVARTMALGIIRMGPISEDFRLRLVSKLNPHFPGPDSELNQELCELLVYLKDPEVIGKALEQMKGKPAAEKAVPILTETVANRSEQYGPAIKEWLSKLPPQQEIAYALSLSHATEGWTTALRKRYFEWYVDAMQCNGGESYRGFLDNMRIRALTQVPEAEKGVLAQLTGSHQDRKEVDFSSLPQPQGPGKAWNRGEVGDLYYEHEEETRDFEHGKKMYAAALCASCHRMQGEGSNIGPDLTQLPNRSDHWSISRSIMTPSHTISDQYAATVFDLASGAKMVGRVKKELADSIYINANPYAPDQLLAIGQKDIVNRSISPVSPMPAGLLNRLNETEVLDLLAYLYAGGDPEHEIYTGEKSD